MDYGRDCDFSRPLFLQFRELMEAVPQLSRGVIGFCLNSDYSNDCQDIKNCYLAFDGERGEDSYYGHTFAGAKNCLDFFTLKEGELCYSVSFCEHCYNLRYSQFCVNCSDSWFLRDCIGCKNCFGCMGLRQRQYCIWNEQKTKEKYEAFMQNFASSKRSVVREMFEKAEQFLLAYPMKALRGEGNENVVGDVISRSKDSYACYESYDLWNCRYCTECLMGARDCLDIHIWGAQLELAYDSCVVGAGARNVVAGYYITEGCDSVYYSTFCSRGSSNLFGCVGLRHKQYCVLNKQYTKDTYEELVSKIIEKMQEEGSWGEFFPPQISMFGYNETMANDYFPLPCDEVLERGWQWCDYESPVEAKRSVPSSQLPDDSRDASDDILDCAVLCEVTGKPFKIIKQELEYYRAHKLPLPLRHPNQRYRDLLKFRNPFKLWKRLCAKCGKEIQTTYSPDRPEIVYCESCYLKEVY